MSLAAEDKKQVIRNLFEHGWNRGHFTSFSDYVAEKVLFNFRGVEQNTDLGQLKHLVTFWRTAFPDLTFEIIAIIVENNLAAANLMFTGTHLGEWQGLPPTGQKIEVEEMMFFRFEKGKIVELWEVYDEASMIGQIKQKINQAGSGN